jgi:signal transduction histidine kinase
MAWTTVLAALLGAGATRGEEVVARFLSPELRRIEHRLVEVARELESLPELMRQPFASRYGYRSGNLMREDEPHWVMIDLGRVQDISRIVAVPVNVPTIGVRGPGYGFPKRFRIEVADNPEMEGAVTAVDKTAGDFPNPGRQPVDFPLDGVKGRYVKFTATRHFPVEEGFIWALEELVVLSGNRSAAVFGDVKASSVLDLYPNWALQRLVDGQSALGMPVSIRKSRTRGYLSARADKPREKKWLTVDLGREHGVDEVRLLPVVQEDFQNVGPRSYPRGYDVELAIDAEFREVTWKYESLTSNLVGYPGSCAVIYPVGGRRGRYLRVEVSELWGQGNEFGYALAEIQAYAGDANVALGKAVTASDATQEGGWSLAAAVDGYGSRQVLIEMPEYLNLVARRGTLEKERDELSERRQSKLRAVELALGYGGGALGVAAACGWGWMLLRQRIMREKAVAQLRDQIARDLHDDIGSNLGGITLLSEMGNAHSTDPQAREDFRVIKEAADEASASMRDIVWLIGRNSPGLREQISKMRQSAQLMLGDREFTIAVEPENFRDRRLSLLFRRHVLFAYKEALNNIRKHSGASNVEVNIRIDSTHLTFSTRDDGGGFEPRIAEKTGHGLANLRRRADRLGGRVRIESSPGEGSEVTFSAPLKS